MGVINSLRNRVSSILVPVKNSMSLPKEFMKFGSGRRFMKPDWTEVIISDRDHYTGYGYAAIRNRANKVAGLASDNIRTDSKDPELVHPYINLIKQSAKFTEYDFWHDISTYLDLEGVYYLMVLRAFDETREDDKFGTPLKFQMLNPYDIQRITNTKTLEVAAYIESRNGFVRTIPPEMIIEIRELNPFSYEETYAMTDAAKSPQFTLKTANDYTRHSLKNNINAPGILSTDVALEEEQFENFKKYVKEHSKGEPIYANGQGAVKWDNMQIELSKSSLKDVNEVNRDELFAVSGVSKTILGIEQSGTTRETSRVQKEQNVEDQILPRIQMIIGALNLDYKNRYPSEWVKTEAMIVCDNPMAVDIDADIKETDLKGKQVDLYQKLINRGVDHKTAAGYVKGEVELDLLKLEKQEVPDFTPSGDEDEEQDNTRVDNASNSMMLALQQGALQNAILRVDEQLAAEAMSRIGKLVKNDFSPRELIPQRIREASTAELLGVMTVFYLVVMEMEGKNQMSQRKHEFNLDGNFSMEGQVRSYIESAAKKATQSHIKTVSDDIYSVAREAALQGKSIPQVEAIIKDKYTGVISQTRVKTIARSETNRGFTRAQFEADRQFIRQNKLQGRVFKVWQTRSENPCPFCQEMQDRGEIPFNEAFANVGDTMEVDGQKMTFGFEDVQAGNAHPNCSCTYELIVKN